MSPRKIVRGFFNYSFRLLGNYLYRYIACTGKDTEGKKCTGRGHIKIDRAIDVTKTKHTCAYIANNAKSDNYKFHCMLQNLAVNDCGEPNDISVANTSR